jgi:hypothetical protein
MRNHHNQPFTKRRNLSASLVAGSLFLAAGSTLLTDGFPRAHAQTTSATLTGTITDPSGAAIPAAHLVVHDIATGADRMIDSNGSGEYTFTSLPPGEYTLNVTRDGFSSYQQKGIVLTVSEQATANVVLPVGATTNTITVTANASVIDTTTAEISNIVNEHAISQLPLNGRDPSSLVLLSPGTTNVLNTGGGYLQSGFSFPTETGASADGGRQGSTYYLLDGVPNVDAYLGLAAPFPNADATSQFRVISNNFDARYGFSPGAVVSIETKSGTNHFHGGIFEFLRNNDLNARDWFTGQLSTLKRSQFGGYIGGPILHDRFFFFANYQGTRSVANGASNTTYTPTAAMLNGDFSAVPITLNAPFATINGVPNQINPAMLNPAAVTLAKTGLPLGQVAASGQVNYATGKIINNFDELTGRLDYNINQNQRLSVRSFTDYFRQPSGDINGNILSVLQLNPYADIFNSPMEYYNNIAQHTWTISPSLLNSFTAFWSQMSSHSSAQTNDASGQPLCLSKLINVSEPGCYIEGLSVTNGFSTGYTEPSSELRTTYGLVDNVTKTLGAHTLAFGVNAWHQFSEQVTQYPAQPIVSFYGSFTGFGLADFLLGDAGGFTQGAGLVQGVHGWQLGLYAQDEYKVRPNVTLTAGLRWDPNLAPLVVGGLGSAFIPGQQSAIFPGAPLGLNFPGDPGVTDSLMPRTYGYFEPRIGLAWQPQSLPKTAVRAGFGLFDAPLPYSAYGHVSEVEPFSPTYTFYAGAAPINFSNPWASFAGTGGKSPFPPFFSLNNKPAADSTFTTPLTVPTVFSNNYHLGVTESWNFSIEQQFYTNFALHLAYVGSESYHQTEAIDQNPGFYNANPSLNGERLRYPNFGQILTDFSNGNASYQALQAGLEKRISQNLQFQSNFTWSKTIDLAASGNIAFGSPELANPFNLGFNRGTSYLNIPLISVTNFVYTTPSLAEHHLLVREALGGWQATGIVTAQSGFPFTIVGASGNNSGALQYGDRADSVPNQPLEEHVGGKQNWLNHYFNTAAFVDNAPGTFGNIGKNTLIGPAVVTADLGADKNWTVREGYVLQFRWEAFNALNHPSFGLPATNVSAINFGSITSTGAVPPRVMQAALKLTF